MTCPVCFGVDTCEVSWCVNMNGARPASLVPAPRVTLGSLTGSCPDCGTPRGKHGYNCPQYPKKGNRMCHECNWYNGKHSVGCQSRGYTSVGQHPDSPDEAPARQAAERARTPGPCPCGIDRRDCEYHR